MAFKMTISSTRRHFRASNKKFSKPDFTVCVSEKSVCSRCGWIAVPRLWLRCGWAIKLWSYVSSLVYFLRFLLVCFFFPLVLFQIGVADIRSPAGALPYQIHIPYWYFCTNKTPLFLSTQEDQRRITLFRSHTKILWRLFLHTFCYFVSVCVKCQ